MLNTVRAAILLMTLPFFFAQATTRTQTYAVIVPSRRFRVGGKLGSILHLRQVACQRLCCHGLPHSGFSPIPNGDRTSRTLGSTNSRRPNEPAPPSPAPPM